MKLTGPAKWLTWAVMPFALTAMLLPSLTRHPLTVLLILAALLIFTRRGRLLLASTARGHGQPATGGAGSGLRSPFKVLAAARRWKITLALVSPFVLLPLTLAPTKPSAWLIVPGTTALLWGAPVLYMAALTRTGRPAHPWLAEYVTAVHTLRGWATRALRAERVQRNVRTALLHRGMTPPKWGAVTHTPGGMKMQVRLTPQTTGDDLEQIRERVAAAAHAREVHIQRDRERADRATLLVRVGDPLTEPSGDWPWQNAPTVSMWDDIPLAQDEDREPVTVSLAGRAHMLLAGVTRAGKSAAQAMPVCAAAKDPNVTLYLLDGKGSDLFAFKARARMYAKGTDEQGMKDAFAVLDAVTADMDARAAWVPTQKLRKMPAGSPLTVLIIDELQEYLAADKAFEGKLRNITSKGAGNGIIVIAATQSPYAKLLPTPLRNNFDVRWAFRCASRSHSDVVLADASQDGWDASTIGRGPEHKGVGLLQTTDGIVRCKSFYLTDEHIEQIAQNAPAGPSPSSVPWGIPSGESPLRGEYLPSEDSPQTGDGGAEPAEPSPLQLPEGVPSPPTFNGYRDGFQAWYRRVYGRSEYWVWRREREQDRAGGRCERCGGRGEHVHHLHYDGVGEGVPEAPGQLQVLCAPCHEVADRERVDAKPARPIERAMAAVRANPELSDRQLGRLAGVDHKTVGKARQRLGTNREE